MTFPHEVDPPADDRVERLGALMFALRAHDFAVELVGDVLHVAAPTRPELVLQVRCVHRMTDAGRMWFVAGDEPLAEAGQFAETITAIKDLTAVRM